MCKYMLTEYESSSICGTCAVSRGLSCKVFRLIFYTCIHTEHNGEWLSAAAGTYATYAAFTEASENRSELCVTDGNINIKTLR